MAPEKKNSDDILELIKKQNVLLEKHTNESSAFRVEIKSALAKMEVHADYSRAKIEQHGESIGKLQAAHNRQKGAIAILSAIGLAGLADFIKKII